MSDVFAVSYWISEHEWERAAESRMKQDSEPIFDYFYGSVKILVGRRHILDRDGYHMSVADLACGLAALLRSEIGIVGDQECARFSQSDDSLEIYFDRRGERIHISSNRPNSEAGETSVAAFLQGSRDFIQLFAKEAVTHVPAALEWSDLVELKSYAR